jgi:hypothetical protein
MKKQNTSTRIDATLASPTSVAAKPVKVALTNRAGAFATPLEKDIDAWLKIGWFRVNK